jgi:hypothetical protein
MDERSRPGILESLDAKLDRYHEETLRRFRALKRRLDYIMATVADLTAASAAMATAVAQIGTDVTAAIADIQALQAGGSGGIAPADLDPIVAALTAATGSLSSASASLEAVLPPKP